MGTQLQASLQAERFLFFWLCNVPARGLGLLFCFSSSSVAGNEAGGAGLGVQAQATCVFEMILLNFSSLLQLPLLHFLSLPICSFFISLFSTPHLPFWIKIPGKLAGSSIHMCKSYSYSFLPLPFLNVDSSQRRNCGVVGTKVRGSVNWGLLLLLYSV